MAQFDKVLSSANGCKLSFRFGSGDEITIIPSSLDTSKSELTFIYEIKSPDSGELKLTALSGTVTDSDGNIIQIGLPSEGKIVISPNTIIADSSKSGAMESDSSIVREGNTLNVRIVTSEKVYVKNGNVISELSSRHTSVPYLGFENSKGDLIKCKNDISNYAVIQESGRTIVTFSYNINEGDSGTPVVILLKVSDIGGNVQNVKYSDSSVVVTATENTPYVVGTPTVKINKLTNAHKNAETLYLLEGDTISVSITYNEKVYKTANYEKIDNDTIYKNSTDLTADNASPIKIKVGSSEKNANVAEISDDGCTVTYEYTVAKNDDGIYNGYNVPADKITDKVGLKNSEFNADNDDSITVTWPKENANSEAPTTSVVGTAVIVDAKAPELIGFTDMQAGFFKEGENIVGKVEFSESVTGSELTGYFADSESQNYSLNVSANDTNLIDFSMTVKAGDNGKAGISVGAGKFKDTAGNSIASATVQSNCQFADTEKPELSIVSLTENGSSVVKYTFTLTDNSSEWSYNYESTSGKGGIANNSFREDDLSIPASSAILDKEYDSNGNLKWVEVQAGLDGVQSLIVKADRFSDVSGNTNDRKESNAAIIDRVAPTINAVNLNPNDWTNKNVVITVQASDANGIKEYSFDDGQTWENSMKKEVSENCTVLIKVKDNADNVSQTFTAYIDKIDKVAPEVNTQETQEGNNIMVQVQASDDKSGIKECTTNGEKITATSEGLYEFYPETNGTYRIVVTDNAGNSSSKTITVSSIDTEKPEITDITVSPTSWTNNNVIVTVSANDSGSGVKDYNFNNNGWNSNNTVQIDTNQTLNIKVRDNRNNVMEKEINISNIDKTLPEITMTKAEDEITVSVSDSDSGIAFLEINGDTILSGNSQEIKTYTKKIDGSKTITVTVNVTDRAGNKANKVETFAVEEKPELVLSVTKNEYINVVTDIDTTGNNNIDYIVLSKEMETTELENNLHVDDADIVFADSYNKNKIGTKLVTGDVVYANNSSDESNRYIIILKGDVDFDGDVDVDDMFEINKCRLGNIEFNKLQKMAGDVVEDSLIDVEDLFQINKYRLGVISKF